MGAESKIEWTDATWNPWHGCTKVSPGCKHCYMDTAKRRYGQDPDTVVRSKTQFCAPLKWKEPRRVFTCSWSDWFHADADRWRSEAWEVIRRASHHTYQILTKRPERILDHLPGDWGACWTHKWPHVWLGVSVENQDYIWRMNRLKQVPAAVRFLSIEPLLGPLPDLDLRGIHWVIVGGESGPGHRPCKSEWVRDIRDQCLKVKVPFFFKQWGGRTPKAGGRELDGRTWDQFPATVERIKINIVQMNETEK